MTLKFDKILKYKSILSYYLLLIFLVILSSYFLILGLNKISGLLLITIAIITYCYRSEIQNIWLKDYDLICFQYDEDIEVRIKFGKYEELKEKAIKSINFRTYIFIVTALIIGLSTLLFIPNSK